MSIVLQGSTSGSVTLQEPAVAGTTTINLPASSGTFVVGSSAVSAAGQIPFSTDGSTYTPTDKIVRGTSVASTSGTSIDFTGIPSWVKRVTVMLNGVSTNSNQPLLYQLGTSGGIVTTGYISSGSYQGAGMAGTIATNGFINGDGGAAGDTISGMATICNLNGNTWVGFSVTGDCASPYSKTGGGAVTLGGTLDRVRITTANGIPTFDAGSINILYE